MRVYGETSQIIPAPDRKTPRHRVHGDLAMDFNKAAFFTDRLYFTAK
jgi:hypothetical protein